MKRVRADELSFWNDGNEATGEYLRVKLLSEKPIKGQRVALGTGMYPRHPWWAGESREGQLFE